MSEQNKIGYNKTALELISSLTSINQSVAFERHADDEDRIISRAGDVNQSIVYIFDAPKEVFDFTGDECSFYNYNEFFTLLSIFEDPDLVQDDVEITVSEARSKIKYRLTDSELIKKGFTTVKFGEPDVSFVMDYELIKKIRTLSGGSNINADRIKFTVSDNTLNYRLYNTKHHNTFDETLDLSDAEDEDFQIEVDMKIWNKIPMASYNVNLKEDGILELDMIREDDISVKIYTADMDDD